MIQWRHAEVFQFVSFDMHCLCAVTIVVNSHACAVDGVCVVAGVHAESTLYAVVVVVVVVALGTD